MTRVNRRGFLTGSAAAAALPLGAGAQQPAPAIVDTNVYLSRWPFRRIPRESPAELAALLRRHGVVQAWAGSFEAVLHRDLGSSNERLAADCREHGRGLLVPFGCVNPKLPDWDEDLRRCHEALKMPGIRVHPNYHNYELNDPDFERLLRAAADRGLLVQIACWMEDERHHHPLMMVPSVDLGPLAALVARVPKARVVISNAFQTAARANPVLRALRASDRVALDFAITDSIFGLRYLIDAAGAERVVFGSYLPMFYIEAAELKMKEIDMTPAETDAILRGNARRLLGA